MPLSEEKRIRIEFEVVDPGEVRPMRFAEAPVIEAADPIVRAASTHGWNAIAGDGRWMVDVGTPESPRRVQIERIDADGTSLLRFVRPGDLVNPAHFGDMLRKNGRIAHAGFGTSVDGKRVMLTATLLEATADAEEITAALTAMASGGEPISTAALDGFDRSGYKLRHQSSDAGVWEDELLRRALSGTGVAFQRSGARAETLVRLADGRTQKVYLFFDRADSRGRQLISMLSICAPAKPMHYPAALAANATFAFATTALIPIGGEEHLVVVYTQLAETVDPEEVLLGIQRLAETGDRIEKSLTGGLDTR